MKAFRIISGILLICISLDSIAQSYNANFQRKQIPRIPLINSQDVKSAEIGEKNDIIIYSDGIDRIIEAISIQSSPGSNDEISFFNYDEYGRKTQQYLPYTKFANNGQFIPLSTAISNQSEFYHRALKVAHDNNPYSKFIYEDSPLQKLIEAGSNGQLWQPGQEGQGHSMKFEYKFNQSEQVRKWVINQNGLGCYTEEYYDPNELFVKQVEDPDCELGIGSLTNEYLDKQGNLILKSQYLNSTVSLHTYYVYDDFGNLRFILPPKAVTLLLETPPYLLNTTSLTEDLIYSFEYDSKKRLVTKKVPGKSEEYFIYDDLDRLILYQDGNLRAENQWKFIKYDVLNRPIIVGILTDNEHIDLVSMQNQVRNFYAPNESVYYEQPFFGSNNIQGYTNASFPLIKSESEQEIIQVLYYDGYDFDTQHIYDFQDHTCQLQIHTYEMVRGLNTAIKNKYSIDGYDYWLYSVYYYDDHSRVIREFKENHLLGYDYTDIQYDWAGLPLFSDYFHYTNINSSPYNLVIHWRYLYDRMGRLSEIGHRMNNSPEFIMIKNKYNEINQLIESNFHSTDKVHWWQSVDYKYNILGWLTNINQSNLYNDNTIINFNQELEANEVVNSLIYDSIYLYITEKQYEGNLSKYLNIAFKDKKKLLVSVIDTPSQTRFIQLNELKSKILDKGVTDSLMYNKLLQIKDISFAFALHDLEFETYGSGAVMLDSLKKETLNQLETAFNITDTLSQHYFIEEVNDFIGSSIGIIYFNEDRDDLFGMDIIYNTQGDDLSGLGGTTRFNGNISNILWQTAGNPGIRGFGFQYDRVNQFTQANYVEKEGSTWTKNVGRYNEFGIDYDENGNIQHLFRNGLISRRGENTTFDRIDQLTYSYNGNQLKAVQDAILDSGEDNNDFKDNGSYESEEYEYDQNGSLISDANKGITSISYNYLNLPVEIIFTDNRIINYLYDASGRKLKLTVTDKDQKVETWDYSGGMVYHNQEPELIEFGIGRAVKMPNNTYCYQYYMKDHLGNIRLVYSDMNNDHQVEVVQENHYYPFGLTMGGLNIYTGTENQHLYQGKELEDKTRLNWYDFQARRFDSQLGRWHAIDPVIQFGSPYVGMGNNPISGVDPDGKSWIFHGYQWFQQCYVNGEPVGDPKPGEIQGYWYWVDDPPISGGGYNSYSGGSAGGAGHNGGGQHYWDYHGGPGHNWGSGKGYASTELAPEDINEIVTALLTAIGISSDVIAEYLKTSAPEKILIALLNGKDALVSAKKIMTGANEVGWIAVGANFSLDVALMLTGVETPGEVLANNIVPIIAVSIGGEVGLIIGVSYAILENTGFFNEPTTLSPDLPYIYYPEPDATFHVKPHHP